MPLKLFHATVANSDTGSLKSLHTLFDMHLDYILAKLKPNYVVRNVQNFELLGKDPSFLKPILTKS